MCRESESSSKQETPTPSPGQNCDSGGLQLLTPHHITATSLAAYTF